VIWRVGRLSSNPRESRTVARRVLLTTVAVTALAAVALAIVLFGRGGTGFRPHPEGLAPSHIRIPQSGLTEWILPVTTPEEQTSGLHEQLASGSLAGTWTIDPARSTAALQSKSVWGLVPVKGVFRDIEGAGTVSAAGDTSGHVSLKTASLDTKNAKRDKHLRSEDFFMTEKYPAITFTVDKVEPAGQEVNVTGTLTVRDQSRPLSFPASVTRAGDAEISLDAAVQVDRSDFGLTWNQMGMSSMHNTITVHAVLTRS
jgi:polyisoprenoid-binding protein YceI